MGKHIAYSRERFTSEKCGWRFSDSSESSIEDFLDSLNDAIEDILQTALPRVSMLKALSFYFLSFAPFKRAKISVKAQRVHENLHIPFSCEPNWIIRAKLARRQCAWAMNACEFPRKTFLGVRNSSLKIFGFQDA